MTDFYNQCRGNTSQTFYQFITSNSSTAGIWYILKAAGDDFSFHFLAPPDTADPVFQPVTVGSTRGQDGMLSFFPV